MVRISDGTVHPLKIGKATDRSCIEVNGCLGANPRSFRWEDIMRRSIFLVSLALALVFSAVFVAPPALADKPSKAGGKGNEKHSQKGSQGKQEQGKGHDQGVSSEKGGHRAKVSQYFRSQEPEAIRPSKF